MELKEKRKLYRELRKTYGANFRPYKGKCEDCGCEYSLGESIGFGPDPYNDEINGDSTPLWQCRSCAESSAWDI